MNEFSHLIEKDERILHTIKPNRVACMLGAWIVMAILLSSGILFFILASTFDNKSSNDVLYIMFTIYAWICIAFLVPIFFLSVAKYNSYLYCVTDKKVIIRSGIIGRDFRVLEIDSITTIDIIVGFSDRVCGGNTATIIFFNASNANYHSSGFNTGYNKNAFMHIEDANAIYREIKALIENIEENKKSKAEL